jgi:hypothetical protein
MNYYLLRVQQCVGGSSADMAAKHMIEASSLLEAEAEADRIVEAHYALDDLSFLKMFDETGLVAARNPEGDWRH